MPIAIMTFPAWVKCDDCDNYLCTYHGKHAHDCPEDECPGLELWDELGLNPYTDPHPGPQAFKHYTAEGFITGY